jgi:hypothetical protein
MEEPKVTQTYAPTDALEREEHIRTRTVSVAQPHEEVIGLLPAGDHCGVRRSPLLCCRRCSLGSPTLSKARSGSSSRFLDALFFSFLQWRFKNLRAAVLGHGFNNTTGLVSVYLVGPMMDCGSQERKVTDETRAHCSAAAERAISVAGLLMATTVAVITGGLGRDSQLIGPSRGAGFPLVGLGTDVSSGTSDNARAVSESPSARSDSRDGRRAPVERNPKFFAKPIARPLSMPTQ